MATQYPGIPPTAPPPASLVAQARGSPSIDHLVQSLLLELNHAEQAVAAEKQWAGSVAYHLSDNLQEAVAYWEGKHQAELRAYETERDMCRAYKQQSSEHFSEWERTEKLLLEHKRLLQDYTEHRKKELQELRALRHEQGRLRTELHSEQKQLAELRDSMEQAEENPEEPQEPQEPQESPSFHDWYDTMRDQLGHEVSPRSFRDTKRPPKAAAPKLKPQVKPRPKGNKWQAAPSEGPLGDQLAITNGGAAYNQRGRSLQPVGHAARRPLRSDNAQGLFEHQADNVLWDMMQRAAGPQIPDSDL